MNKKRCLVITVVAVAAALFSASSCTTPTNHEPIIASLEAESEWTTHSGSLQVTCTASDPDGDELSYIWWASEGEINGGGATVIWTAPEAEGSQNVTVKVIDGRGGEVTDYVTITVAANEPPTITSLIANRGWTTPSGSIQVTCSASDPDGDELSYEWSASSGAISGTGEVVSWTAPGVVGTYSITVVARDGHGSSATESVTIRVLTGQPPVIEALLVTAEHCYLKTYSWGYKVGKGQEYAIECIVVDTGIELFYEWSCTGGEPSEVSEDGSMIMWTAPNTEGDVTVTVTVSDIVGNMVSESVLLEVVACSPCTFGC